MTPKLPTKNWRAWFDGAAEPTNPGERGLGALLLGPNGERVEVSAAIGHGTNNEAEYEALARILEAAIAAGATGLQVFGDSQLVVSQVNGNWKVKSPTLQGYHSRAVHLLHQAKATISWIPREENSAADELSKKALVGVLPGKEWGKLTAIGKALGVSAVAVGKKLTALGLKDGTNPTPSAIEHGYGQIRETFFGSKPEWHVEKLAELLKTPVPAENKE